MITSISQCTTCSPLFVVAEPQVATELAFNELVLSGQQGCQTCSIIEEGIQQVINLQELLEQPSTLTFQRSEAKTSRLWTTINFEHRKQIRVDFYAAQDSNTQEPWRGLEVAQHDVPHPSDRIRLEQMVTWLNQQMNQCYMDHSDCKRWLRRFKPLPTHVLDLETSKEDPMIHLVESTSSLKGNYVTLSHCWGNFRPVVTTKANLNDHIKGIPFLDLPRTFQDAVMITRKLGIRYLWIDSLCIVQDDLDDWEREASKMADVYSNSYLTIAATSAKDSRDGCFVDLPAVQHFGINRTIQEDERNVMTIYVRLSPERKTTQQAHLELIGGQLPASLVLQSRAWVFQERMLSPRVVHCHKWDVFFECRTKLECRCGTRHFRYSTSGDVPVRPELKLGPESSKAKVCNVWEDLIKDYSMLMLTNLGDKLPALSGIAKLFAAYMDQETGQADSQYLAGVWKPLLPHTLVWYADHNNSGRGQRSPETFQAPSWSWASINHPVTSLKRGKQHEHFAILDAWCRVPGKNPYGRVIDGRLRLQGVYIQNPLLDNNVAYHICLRFPDLGKHFWYHPNDIEGCLELPKQQVMPWILLLVMVDETPSEEIVLVLEERATDCMTGVFARLGMATTTNIVGDEVWRRESPNRIFEVI